MGITKQRAVAACNDFVRDQKELGQLWSLLNRLPDERLTIVPEGASNEAIVEFLRAEMAGVAGPGPSSAGGAGPGPSSQAGRDWTQMFIDAGIKPDNRIISKVIRYFAPRIPFIRSHEDAEQLYNDAAALPATTTKKMLYEEEHIKLNGMFSSGVPSRAMLLYAFRGTTPFIMKILTSLDNAKKERDVAKAVEAGAHLVGPVELIEFKGGSIIELNDDWRPARAGLLMPVYASTLEHVPKPMSEADLAKVGQQVAEALDFMHECGFAHCDVKAPNIFIDVSGDAFLGDFGAAVKLTEGLTEGTKTHFPRDTVFERGSEELDSWLLAVTLLEKLGSIKLGPDAHLTSDDVKRAAQQVQHQGLQGVFSKLLSVGDG